ncbi:hypothetical protein LUZ61_000288 [Rhynchospora tenuis]|uniref:Protein FAR1-RELATED SEQUENCE n=1 Tax=Rhynchospora tenuis TaxID=198213 RepID=A0AAD6EPP7_9POAL|nr:hypothetical protein LUZ61_000288 [Rhynchospora tenuis]
MDRLGFDLNESYNLNIEQQSVIGQPQPALPAVPEPSAIQIFSDDMGSDVDYLSHPDLDNSVVEHAPFAIAPAPVQVPHSSDVQPSSVLQNSTEDSNETVTHSFRAGESIIYSNVLPPKKGMTFSSIDEAENFINNYGYKIGFSVVRNGGGTATLDHTHEVCPQYSHKLTGFRELQDHIKKQLEANHNSGVPVNANINAVTQMAGGADFCGFTERDARNYLDSLRRLQFKNGDAEALMKYFRDKQSADPNFFYRVKFNEENRLENVFWADSICRASSKYFGDVVSFDTTYIVNK